MERPSIESLKGYGQILLATSLFVDFTKAFDSIHRGKMEKILLPKETVVTLTILYRNTKEKYVHWMETQNTSAL